MSGPSPALERRSAIRDVRPRLAVLWIAVLLIATLVLNHPAALAGLLAGIIVFARDVGAGSALWRTLRVASVFVAVLFAVQILIDRNGLTVILRLGDAGPLSQLDITLEAVAGATSQALRVLCGLAVTTLGLALIDVDRVLGSVRRRAPRFGVTATLALRLAPALAADGHRYADGLRSRAGATTLSVRERTLVVNALVARTLDRASDAAGVLELRGLGRPVPPTGRPAVLRWSRTEQASAASSLGAATSVIVIKALGTDRFITLTELHAASAWLALAAGLLVVATATVPLMLVTRRSARRGSR